jgi:N-acetylglucosamine-6-phosphate deacetylase
VLPAHLESNFISPEYRGAQPASCLRSPGAGAHEGDYSAREILDAIAASRPDVGIVTLAPELPGGLDLVTSLVSRGPSRVTRALWCRFRDRDCRDRCRRTARDASLQPHDADHPSRTRPGRAVLAREEIAAELICDGYHVHPAMCRLAMAAKGAHGVMAITDGTSLSGLPVGSVARLGGQRIQARGDAAFLEEGTLAGSTLTMDRAFRTIVTRCGGSLVEAATMCATTPARELGLTGFGVIAAGAMADLVVLDRGFRVVRTFIGVSRSSQ